MGAGGFFRLSSSMNPDSSRQENPFWKIGKSGIHARGVFAARPIPRGSRIIEYVGVRVSKSESMRRGNELYERARQSGTGLVYMFELNKRVDIDGNVGWNPARLINHGCRPNCESQIIRGRIWIIARRHIKEGEELTYDYGYDIEHFEEHPCRCGHPRCVGYIVRQDQRPRLKRLIARKSSNGPARS